MTLQAAPFDDKGIWTIWLKVLNKRPSFATLSFDLSFLDPTAVITKATLYLTSSSSEGSVITAPRLPLSVWDGNKTWSSVCAPTAAGCPPLLPESTPCIDPVCPGAVQVRCRQLLQAWVRAAHSSRLHVQPPMLLYSYPASCMHDTSAGLQVPSLLHWPSRTHLPLHCHSSAGVPQVGSGIVSGINVRARFVPLELDAAYVSRHVAEGRVLRLAITMPWRTSADPNTYPDYGGVFFRSSNYTGGGAAPPFLVLSSSGCQ